MFERYLVPTNTTVTAKGDGEAVDVSSAENRVFLVLLEITNHLEQEALDVSVFGSSDATNWSTKPLMSFPQKFYKGETPMLLDLREQADVRYLRAHWEASRWGRGSETPMFEFCVKLTEVEPTLLREATS